MDGFPEGNTEGLNKDLREQLAGSAFQPAALAGLLQDPPWKRADEALTAGPGFGLIVAGQDVGSTRIAFGRLQKELRGMGLPPSR